MKNAHLMATVPLTLLHPERPKFHRVLAFLSVIGLTPEKIGEILKNKQNEFD